MIKYVGALCAVTALFAASGCGPSDPFAGTWCRGMLMSQKITLADGKITQGGKEIGSYASEGNKLILTENPTGLAALQGRPPRSESYSLDDEYPGLYVSDSGDAANLERCQ